MPVKSERIKVNEARDIERKIVEPLLLRLFNAGIDISNPPIRSKYERIRFIREPKINFALCAVDVESSNYNGYIFSLFTIPSQWIQGNSVDVMIDAAMLCHETILEFTEGVGRPKP